MSGDGGYQEWGRRVPCKSGDGEYHARVGTEGTKSGDGGYQEWGWKYQEWGGWVPCKSVDGGDHARVGRR